MPKLVRLARSEDTFCHSGRCCPRTDDINFEIGPTGFSTSDVGIKLGKRGTRQRIAPVAKWVRLHSRRDRERHSQPTPKISADGVCVWVTTAVVESGPELAHAQRGRLFFSRFVRRIPFAWEEAGEAVFMVIGHPESHIPATCPETWRADSYCLEIQGRHIVYSVV